MTSINVHSDTIKVLSWNMKGFIETIDGLRVNKFNEHNFTNKLSAYDIVFLEETHLDKDNVKDINIPNFSTPVHYMREKRKNAQKASGGISVFIKADLRQHVKLLPQSNSDIVWVRIPTMDKHGQDTFICGCYIPPEHSSYGKDHSIKIWDCLERDVEIFSTKGNVIVCGDMNARTGSTVDYITVDSVRYDNAAGDEFNEHLLNEPMDIHQRCSMDNTTHKIGRRLIDLCIDNNLVILNGRTLGDLDGRFTSHQPNGSSVVDYFICTHVLYSGVVNMTVEALNEYSDHCPIRLTIHIPALWKRKQERSSSNNYATAPEPNNQDKTSFVWDEHSAESLQCALKTQAFTMLLRDIDNKIDGLQDNTMTNTLDEIVDEFTDIMTKASKLSLKCRLSRKKRNKKRSKKWFDQECYVQRRELKSLRNAFNRHPYNRSLRDKLFSLSRTYNKALKRKKQLYKNKLIATLNDAYTNDPTSVWKTLKLLKDSENPNDRNRSNISSCKWINHLQNLIGTDVEVEQTTKDNVRAELNNIDINAQSAQLDLPITMEEIAKAASNLKSKKAPGVDGITNEIIKASLPATQITIKKLFQAALHIGSCPKAWATGINIPIYKSGDPMNPGNYRGITLNNNLGKFFSQIINNRLNGFLESNHLYAREQAGFRKKSRTTDQIFILKKIVDGIITNRKDRLYACFVDFQKAFDNVWHEALLLKLNRIGVMGNCFNVIRDMYSKSTICTKTALGHSHDIPVRKGVHQGNTLSPTLFNIFINDLPDYLRGNDSPSLNSAQNTEIPCLLYADDLVILSTSKRGLQNKLNRLNDYSSEWGIKINKEKTKVIIFTRTDPKVPILFNCGTHMIESVDQYKYLGVIFHKSGKFLQTQEHLAKQANKASHALRRLIRGREMKVTTMMQLFYTLVAPVSTYGAEVWFPSAINIQNEQSLPDIFDKCLSNNLPHEQVHLKFSKRLLGVHSKAMNLPTLAELGQLPVGIKLIEQTINFWTHIVESEENSYLRQAYADMIDRPQDSSPQWIHFIRAIIGNLGLDHNWILQSAVQKNALMKTLRRGLEYEYVRFWQGKKTEGSKLQYYNTITDGDYDCEAYLTCVTNPKHRKALCRLRISAHDLKIERGRYTNTPREDRKCTVCGVIEDELHFLDSCTRFHDLRLQLMEHARVNARNPSQLMTMQDVSIQQQLAEFVYNCMIIRNNDITTDT